MRDIYDIVKDDIISAMDNTVKIVSADAVSGGTQDIILCDNKWIRVGQYLTDADSKKWKINSIGNDGIVNVTKPTGATDLVKRQVLTLRSPQFLFGTHYSANNEYVLKGNDNRVKLPLIWLVETIRETEFDRTKSLERKSDLRLYFLDDNNPKQYLNADYRANVVTPMLGLKDEFIKVVQSNVLFDLLGDWQIRPITRFGNEDEKGSFENILDDNLSGVELTISLPIFKNKNCNC